MEHHEKDDIMLGMIKMIAPGTPLRDGLENVLRAKSGALIVVGDSEEVMKVVDGGFFINSKYSPTYLYELAKMDGAIVLSKDLKRILYANALLVPDPTIPTGETGTRHKCGERVAKQTSEAVICISHRRGIITVYKGFKRYILKETSSIIAMANQALQTLEKYRFELDRVMNSINILEFEDLVTLEDVTIVIQKMEMVLRIVTEIEWQLCELGNEGRLIEMQIKELLINVEVEELLIIQDYMAPVYSEEEQGRSISIQLRIRKLSYEKLMDVSCICNTLGYKGEVSAFNVPVYPKGRRMLNKIPRIPPAVIENLINAFHSLQGILEASIEELDETEGIGETRARVIKTTLEKIKEQLFVDRMTFNSSKMVWDL